MNAHRNKGFKSVSSEEFAGIIGDTATVQLLDVRTKEEYEEGHIADALLVDFYSYNFEEQAAAKLSKEKAVAVYCRSGRRSASAAQKLVKLGYEVAEDATKAAQEVAATAGSSEQEPSNDESESAPKIEESAIGDSPLYKQFCDLKKKHHDTLLLFRKGDFYECYEEDAIKAAEILSLTQVNSSKDNITVAGFPHYALDAYLPKFIRAGLRVAICDELEAPAPAKRGRKPKGRERNMVGHIVKSLSRR